MSRTDGATAMSYAPLTTSVAPGMNRLLAPHPCHICLVQLPSMQDPDVVAVTRSEARTAAGLHPQPPLERDDAAPSPLSFELARAASTGTWVAALRDASSRVQPSMVASGGADAWLAEFRTWLTRKGRRPDEESLQAVLRPLANLADLLADHVTTGGSRSPKTPIDLTLTTGLSLSPSGFSSDSTLGQGIGPTQEEAAPGVVPRP